MDETPTAERSRSYNWDDPHGSARAIPDMTGLEFMSAIGEGRLPAAPIAATLAMELDEVAEGRVVFAFTPGEFHYNPIGSVHGGVIATLIDSAASCAVHTTCKRGEAYTTVSLQTDYFKAITHAAGRIRCVGTVVKRGARLGVADAELVDDAGTVYGRGSVTCLIFPLERG